MDNDFATGYALGSDSGNGNNGGFLNGDGWWAIILFAIVLTITCINLLVSKKHVHYS